MADAGEDIEDFTLMLCRVVHAARCQQRQVQRTCDANRRTVAMLFLAVKVALYLDIDIPLPEEMYQAFDALLCRVVAAMCQRSCKRPLAATRQADKTFVELRKICSQRRALCLRALAQLVTRDETAKVLIPDAGLCQ